MDTWPSVAVIVVTGFLASFGVSTLLSRLIQKMRTR